MDETDPQPGGKDTGIQKIVALSKKVQNIPGNSAFCLLYFLEKNSIM